MNMYKKLLKKLKKVVKEEKKYRGVQTIFGNSRGGTDILIVN